MKAKKTKKANIKSWKGPKQHVKIDEESKQKSNLTSMAMNSKKGQVWKRA